MEADGAVQSQAPDWAPEVQLKQRRKDHVNKGVKIKMGKTTEITDPSKGELKDSGLTAEDPTWGWTRLSVYFFIICSLTLYSWITYYSRNYRTIKEYLKHFWCLTGFRSAFHFASTDYQRDKTGDGEEIRYVCSFIEFSMRRYTASNLANKSDSKYDIIILYKFIFKIP